MWSARNETFSGGVAKVLVVVLTLPFRGRTYGSDILPSLEEEDEAVGLWEEL